MDDVSYGALAAALTVASGVWTWFAYRRRGLGAGLKGAGITLLPVAAYLTETLEMFGRIADAVADWAVRLVFSPVVWVGIVLAGVGVLLYGAGRVVERRSGDTPVEGRRRGSAEGRQLPASSPRGRPPVDDDLADIEALLRERGIT